MSLGDEIWKENMWKRVSDLEQAVKECNERYWKLVTTVNKLVDRHLSDCAAHNEPAYPNGPCDCQPCTTCNGTGYKKISKPYFYSDSYHKGHLECEAISCPDCAGNTQQKESTGNPGDCKPESRNGILRHFNGFSWQCTFRVSKMATRASHAKMNGSTEGGWVGKQHPIIQP